MISAAAITLVIHLANLSGAPPSVVREAQSAVSDILADIDVAVDWSEASATSGANAIRLTMLPYEGGALQTRDGAIMGAASRTARGTGIAWVYYRRVLEEAEHYAVPPARVLACVMAHEIGHLVLASNGHDADGLMRAVWNKSDFRRASTGRLRFSGVTDRAGTARDTAPRALRPPNAAADPAVPRGDEPTGRTSAR